MTLEEIKTALVKTNLENPVNDVVEGGYLYEFVKENLQLVNAVLDKDLWLIRSHENVGAFHTVCADKAEANRLTDENNNQYDEDEEEYGQNDNYVSAATTFEKVAILEGYADKFSEDGTLNECCLYLY